MLIPLSDEEVADLALAMTDLERQIICLCSEKKSWGYRRLAEQTGATYAQVQDVGRRLQAKRLATTWPVRRGREFHGSAIFLNTKGEHVKLAVEALERIRSR